MTFAVPFALALLVGAIGITRQAWRDEHATWWAATIAWPDFLSLLSRVDIVLAPYYLFMRPWVAIFGDSVVALRLPSLLAMATAAGLVGVLGTRLYHPWVGLTAGALFALLPSISRYAQEARPYAFAVCFAIATFLALLSRRWILLALFVTLTGLAHLIALTVLLAHLPLILPTRRPANSALPAASSPLIAPKPAAAGWRSRFARFRGYGALPRRGDSAFPESARVMAAPPHHPTDPAAGADGVGGGGWVGREGDWWRWGAAVAVGVVLVVPLGVMGLGQAGQVDWIDAGWRSLAALPTSLARSAAVSGALGALAVLGVVVSRADRVLAMLIVWAVAPPLVVFVAAPQFFYYRYLLFTLVAWAVLAAAGAFGAARGVSRWRRGVLAVVLCAMVLALGVRDQAAVRRSPLAGDQDYRGAAAYLAGHMGPGDAVAFAGYPDKRERLGFGYELRGRQALRECAELTLCQGRVWLVSTEAVTVPPGFVQLDRRSFQGIQLRLLSRV